jgi:hypothetical protein
MDEALGGFGEINAEECAAGRENKINARRHEMLVPAVKLAEAAFGPGAMHRVAHGSPGGDHPHTGGSGWFAKRADAPRELKDPAVDAAALFTDGAEIAIAPQALPGAETHD